MSANNQTLIKEYKGKWYIFTNIMAESWCMTDDKDEIIEGRDNELLLKNAAAICDTRDEAFDKAWTLDNDDDMGGTEYGVQFNRLCKDDTEVKIIE